MEIQTIHAQKNTWLEIISNKLTRMLEKTQCSTQHSHLGNL